MVHIGPELLLDESLSTVQKGRLHPRQRTDNNHPQNAILPDGMRSYGGRAGWARSQSENLRSTFSTRPRWCSKSRLIAFAASTLPDKKQQNPSELHPFVFPDIGNLLDVVENIRSTHLNPLSYKRRIKKHRNQNRQVSEKSSSGLFNRRAHGSKSLHVSCSQ